MKKIVSNMTLEEKANMLTGALELMKFSDVERFGIKGTYMADGPHGVRNAKNSDTNATSFPCLAALGSSWDRKVAYKMGQALADDCIFFNKSLILGPGANIKRVDVCGRNFEYLSEDPVLSGEMAAEYIKGVQNKGVGTSLKHFAVNNQEVDRLFVSAEIDERTLREIYLKSFEIAVKKANPASIMCALNKVNAILCSENKFLLTEILKKEWGYEGFVVSDWGCSKNVAKSVMAGLDLQMPRKENMPQMVKEAIENGTLTEEALNDSVERILNFLVKYSNPQEINYDRDVQHNIAREIEEESIVMLKNDEDVLPITPKKYKKIVVFGEYAEKPVISGYGSAVVYTKKEYIDIPLECLRKALPDVEFEYIPLYSTNTYHDKMFSEHLAELNAVDNADLVLMFVGRQQSVDTEGTDRVTSHIDPYYELYLKRIYAKNTNIVMVIQSGGVVIPLNWQDKGKGIVEMWYGGEAAGQAIANILCGKINPSGKLAETFPLKSRTDIDYPGDGYKVCYDEKWAVGYRYYDMNPNEVWFPFGHGLSYTTFKYSNLIVEPFDNGFNVCVDVTNVGDVPGKEVVQLYISDRVSTVSKPKKELKDFEKISLNPNETKQIKFRIEESQLAYYNTNLKDWITEPGVYDILIGASSTDIRLKGEYLCDKESVYTLNYAAQQIVG